MRGVIVPPSKLIVKTNPPKGFLFIRGGVIVKGRRLLAWLTLLLLLIHLMLMLILSLMMIAGLRGERQEQPRRLSVRAHQGGAGRGLLTDGIARRHQSCHCRKRATSVPAEGPPCRLDFARHCEFPLGALKPQKWHVHGTLFGFRNMLTQYLPTQPTTRSVPRGLYCSVCCCVYYYRNDVQHRMLYCRISYHVIV